MNIFYLDPDPEVAARYHCDKHVVKMITESAQMLSTAHHILDGPTQGLYKPTHANHPCTVWVRQSEGNYDWLFQLYKAQAYEYQKRYWRVHKAWDDFKDILKTKPKNIPKGEFAEPPRCMPEQFHKASVVDSYREFYNLDKYRFAVWKNSSKPFWFCPGQTTFSF